MPRPNLHGFYAILDRDGETLARQLAQHACCLQVRLKPRGRRVGTGLTGGPDGVHLGQTDLPNEEARRLAGARLFVGVSTHDLDQVRIACAAGADYLGFGPVFATSTKENPDAVQGLDGLRAAVAASTVPIVAIGGITAAQVAALYATRAAGICRDPAGNGPGDPARAAGAFLRS